MRKLFMVWSTRRSMLLIVALMMVVMFVPSRVSAQVVAEELDSSTEKCHAIYAVAYEGFKLSNIEALELQWIYSNKVNQGFMVGIYTARIQNLVEGYIARMAFRYLFCDGEKEALQIKHVILRPGCAIIEYNDGHDYDSLTQVINPVPDIEEYLDGWCFEEDIKSIISEVSSDKVDLEPFEWGAILSL